MNVRIAKAAPFSGAPTVLAPSVFGVTVGKHFIYRIPAIGERPLTFTAADLPEPTSGLLMLLGASLLALRRRQA